MTGKAEKSQNEGKTRQQQRRAGRTFAEGEAENGDARVVPVRA